LQLQNNLAIGIEDIHALYASKFKQIWLFNFGDDI